MYNVLLRIRALARLIVLDGLRRHAVIGLVLFAMAGITGGLLFFDFIPRDIGRASNDFFFSVTWITGFIFLLFHAVQVMSWESERGALHTFLARPISRNEYALALFVGLAILLLALNLILSCIGWAVLKMIKASVDEVFFEHLSLLFFILTAVGLYVMQLMLLAVILLISSVVRGSFPVLLLTLCFYFISTGLPVVRSSIKQKIFLNSGKSIEIFLQWLTAFFPDISALDFKNLVVSGENPMISEVTISFALSIVYIIIVLCLACIIYNRRDLQ